MEPETYLSHEKLRADEGHRFRQRLRGYERFDIGAMGEFDVDVLVEQYAGRDEAAAIYPDWRGGYYFAGKPKADKGRHRAARSAVCVPLVESGESGGVCGRVCKIAGATLSETARRWEQMAKSTEDAPPADSWRTLRGRHAWLTEEGVVVIEVRGDAVLISESLDDATTKKVEADFWPEEKTAPAKP